MSTRFRSVPHLLCAAFIFVSANLAFAQSDKSTRPNFLLIIANDLALAQANPLKESVGGRDHPVAENITLVTDHLVGNDSRQALDATKRQEQSAQAPKEAKPKRNQVLLNADVFQINGRHAFIMKPETPASNAETSASNADGKPWIFYGPTLPAYPDKNETWMHQKFLDAGVAVAGIDIGEAYGSPLSQPHFDALYDEMISRGYSARPALLGRSRGGLYVSRFAIERPERVAAIGGIYPVFDYTAYPGVERAAAAYGVTADELQQRQAELNPIKKADLLAQAKIPVFIIHGMDDKVVPLETNSHALEAAYHRNGQASNITVRKIEGQGHNFWPGFFQCQELVDFLIKSAKGK